MIISQKDFRGEKERAKGKALDLRMRKKSGRGGKTP